MTLTHPFAPQFNPDARIQARLIGAERQPLLLIDEVLTNPEGMVAFAAQAGRFAAPPRGSLYPGVNGMLPETYLGALRHALQPVIQEVFAIRHFDGLRCDGFLGLTTASLDDLNLLQRTPHHDSADTGTLAMIHYFCGAPYKGTAFFRHRASGFEYVDRGRSDDYHAQVKAELAIKEGLPRTFVGAETPFYDQIGYVPAAFNRLAIYRTTSLHCAILDGAPLIADPARGRLTANVFFGDPG